MTSIIGGGLLCSRLLQDQVAIDADAVDAEQGDVLPPDAFAVGLQETPADQREAARHEDDERPAGPAPPEVERNEQRRERRGARAIILQDGEQGVAHRRSTRLLTSTRLPSGRSEEHTSELQSLMRISYA